MKRCLLIAALVIIPLTILLYCWQSILDVNSQIVIYFGRPGNVFDYVILNWDRIGKGAAVTTFVAFVSLALSGVVAVGFLAIGLSSEAKFRLVEHFAAISQTVPVLVTVTVFFILEKTLVKIIGLNLGFIWYCFIPVSVALFFPPLVYGIKGVRDIDSSMKGLLRIWGAPQGWRIKRIFLPEVLPHIMTGLRASSTWAVSATLITEGLVHGVVGSEYSIGKHLMRPFSGSVHPGQTLTLIIVATLLGLLVYLVTGRVQVYTQKRIGSAREQERNYPISG